MVVIREEQEGDAAGVWRVNCEAFDRENEAALVDRLRAADAVTLSLVALVDDEIVGHILFSPVVIEGDGEPQSAVALGPMAVAPAYQGEGIGSQLVQTGLMRCQEAGHPIVIVLGHPDFYPRFGFQPSKPFGIQSEWNLPEEVFMVRELQEGGLAKMRGTVRYRPEFSGV